MALGIGGGPFFVILEGSSLTPSTMFFGRSMTYEQDVCRAFGVRLDEQTVISFDETWRQLTDFVRAGRPVLLVTDVKYLPHYNTTSHFNGHRVVLGGFDEEAGIALLADTQFPGLQEVPIAALRESMLSEAPPVTDAGCSFGVFERERQPAPIQELVPAAVRAAAAALLSESDFMGLPGIERLARGLGQWGEKPDWAWSARFGYQVIEKRGTGGGLFRKLYTQFLREATDAGVSLVAPLVAKSGAAAEAWTNLAAELKAVSERKVPEFKEAAVLAGKVVVAERALWESAAAI